MTHLRVVFRVLVVLVTAACGGSGATPSDETSSPSEESTGGEAAGGEETRASAAGEVAPSHGATLFAVYVVVADAGSPALEEAASPLRERSIHVSVGELACDSGAVEALGAALDAHAVSVMFDTREDADAFAATLASPPAGIAQITVGCAD